MELKEMIKNGATKEELLAAFEKEVAEAQAEVEKEMKSKNQKKAVKAAREELYVALSKYFVALGTSEEAITDILKEIGYMFDELEYLLGCGR